MDDQDIPPNRVTFKNLASRAQSLRELLTEPIFTRLTRGYEEYSAAKGLSEHFRRLASVHPFVVSWHDLQQGIEKSLQAGSLQISEQATFLLDLRFGLSRLRM